MTNSLPIKSRSEAKEEALGKIREAMYDEYPGLLTRWPAINKVVGKVFRFGQIYYIPGLSGSGKSFYLNMLREDFANPELNGHLMEKKPYKILSFCFEMSSADEIIRTFSSELKVSYGYLLSAQNQISKEFYKKIEERAKKLDNDIIHYVEDSGNVKQMWATAEKFNQENPDYRLVITIDHTTLTEYLSEKGEVELISNVAKFCMLCKKRLGAFVIPVGQLRDDIEKAERKNQPAFHFPTRNDIYGGKSIYMASDIVSVIHRPYNIGIYNYGPDQIPTKFSDGSDIVALHFLKGRFTGTEGPVLFKNKFDQGTMEYYNPNEEPDLNQNPFS